MKTWTIGATFGLANLLTTPALAQEGRETTFWFEEQTFFSEGQVQFQAAGLLSHYLSFFKAVGIFGCFQAGDEYAQAYGGPAFAPLPWLQTGLGAGAGGVGAFLWLKKNGYSFLAAGNVNLHTVWYKAEFNYRLDKVLQVGAIAQRFNGIGPRLEFKSPKTGIVVWGAPLYDLEKAKLGGLLAIRLDL